MTLEDYFQEIKSTLLSPLHYNKIIKQSFEHLTNLYVDMLIFRAQQALGVCKEFKSDWVTIIMARKQESEKTSGEGEKASKASKKQNKEAMASTMRILTDCKLVSGKILKEREFFLQKIKQNYAQALGKLLAGNIEKTFDIIIGLLSKPNCDIEGLFLEVYEIFKDKGIFVLEVSFCVRQDINADLKRINTIRYNEIIRSLAKK